MTRARDIADLVDANGDIVAGALDNVPAADLVNDTTPQLGGNLDLNSSDITGTGDINTTGDLTLNNRLQLNLKNNADVTNIDFNTISKNSLSYALGSGHTNAPMQGINSMVLDLSTEGLGGTHNSGVDTRGAQLWFTDVGGSQNGTTADGRFHIRVKQGATWHPWEKVLTTRSFRRNFAQQSGTMLKNNSTYSDIAGCTITVTPLSTASRFLIMARWAGYFQPNGDAKGRILRNGSQIYQNERVAGNASTQHESCVNYHIDHPNTTGSVTYNMQGAMTGNTGTFDFGHSSNPCQLLIMEFEG